MDERRTPDETGYRRFMAQRSVWLLAALLLTAGCGGSQKGATPPPPVPAAPTSSAPSPSPSPTPFVTPADREGAFAFVRAYFAALLDRPHNRGQAATFAQLRPPYRKDTCSCLSIITSRASTALGPELKVFGHSQSQNSPRGDRGDRLFLRSRLYLHGTSWTWKSTADGKIDTRCRRPRGVLRLACT